jgi:hypothetical protein
VAAFSAIGLFYPQKQADALPGWGGTDEKECTITVCLEGCDSFEVGTALKKVAIHVERDAGSKYQIIKGTERFCKDEFKYCSWDWGCKA